MSDSGKLTPGEKKKIYEDEKIRIKAREEREGLDFGCGCLFLFILAVIIYFFNPCTCFSP